MALLSTFSHGQAKGGGLAPASLWFGLTDRVDLDLLITMRGTCGRSDPPALSGSYPRLGPEPRADHPAPRHAPTAAGGMSTVTAEAEHCVAAALSANARWAREFQRGCFDGRLLVSGARRGSPLSPASRDGGFSALALCSWIDTAALIAGMATGLNGPASPRALGRGGGRRLRDMIASFALGFA